MPTIDANGLSIAYAVDGSGPPLILLHGATGSGASHFASLLPVVARSLRVHAPDARGHAGTRWDPSDGFATADLVQDLAAFADALGLTTFHLLGYSMGAMTALEFAARWPGRLQTLVIVSLAPEREPRLSVGRRLMDPKRIDRDDPAWAAELAARHDPVQGPGAWRRLLTAIVADVATQPLLTPAELRAIETRTLVMVGDRDPFVPVDHAAGLARQVRDGRLLVLPGVGHDAIFGATPVLHAALTEFYGMTEPVERGRAGHPPTTEDPR